MNDSRASAYVKKAQRALQGARLLLGAGDGDGACNRAYYAMFDAARAALLALAADAETSAKTHRGLIASFGRKLVMTGHVDPGYGRSLKQIEELRMVAHYLGDQVTNLQAAEAVSEAEAFVAEMQRLMAERGVDKTG